MVFHVTEVPEPKGRDLIEDCAFARNGIGQDHIERGKAIRRDK